MSATFSPDGTRIVTASQDRTARVWDAAGGKELAVLRGHEREVRTAAFSPDGTRIVTAGDNTARVWDPAGGRELALLRGHEAQVVSAAFSPDGTRIVTASWDKTARVWDSRSYLKRLLELKAFRRAEERFRPIVLAKLEAGESPEVIRKSLLGNPSLPDLERRVVMAITNEEELKQQASDAAKRAP